MGETVLSEELLGMISELNEIHEKKAAHTERIKMLESKLTMAREANLALINHEQELVNKLASRKIYFGTRPLPPPKVTQTEYQEQASTNLSQDQIAALLKSLFQNTNVGVSNSVQPVHAPQPEPTNIYTPIVATPLQSSGYSQPVTSLLDSSIPDLLPPKQVSPTSAPGMSVRRINN